MAKQETKTLDEEALKRAMIETGIMSPDESVTEYESGDNPTSIDRSSELTGIKGRGPETVAASSSGSSAADFEEPAPVDPKGPREEGTGCPDTFSHEILSRPSLERLTLADYKRECAFRYLQKGVQEVQSTCHLRKSTLDLVREVIFTLGLNCSVGVYVENMVLGHLDLYREVLNHEAEKRKSQEFIPDFG